MAFQIPLHFEDLTRSSAGVWKVSAASFRDATADALLELIQDDPSSALSTSAPPSDHFKALFTLIHRYTHLSKPHREALIEATDQLCRTATITEPSHVKIAAYFASGLAVTASTVSPACKFWEKSGRETILEAVDHIASNLPRPSPFSAPDTDQFAGLLLRMALQVLEQPSAARDKNARGVLARNLSSALLLDPNQTLPAITALLHALNRHEHLPVPVAELLCMMVKENEALRPFVSEFVREVARLNSDDLARDTTAAKACSSFIGELSERLPNVLRANLALLLSQLDGESYMMRNGIVHVIGTLIKASPDADDPLLDVLIERSFRDIHAFTRSKAMQTWISLAQARVIPNRLFPVIADMAASRLDDKTAAVRKYATQLLVALLRNNPFGPALRKSHYQEKLNEVTTTDEVAPDNAQDVADDAQNEDIPNSERELDAEEDLDNEGTPDMKDDCERGESPGESLEDLVNEKGNEEETEQKEVSQETLKKRYYTAAVSFIHAVEMGLEKVYNMLRSKSITDVSEAVSLLITAVQFQIEAAAGRAVRNMLPLILARESNIRSAAVSAYVKLLAPSGLESIEEKEPAMTVANGLTALGVGATTGELACLEALISAMATSREACVVSSAVIAVLWDMFSGKVPGVSEEQRRAACILVGMVAADRPESLLQRVQLLESIGLPNPSFARWSCVALCKLPPGSDVEGRLSKQLSDLAKTSTDLSTVEQAVNTIFCLSLEPEVIIGGLIRDLACALHASPTNVPVSDLSRFLVVIGHVAVKELVRVEGLVSQVRSSIASGEPDDENNEQEEQAGAEADKALELAEKELVSPTSLLGRYGDLARKIAGDRNAPAELQASSVLCMAKLMCVEAKYCENNLRLLFSILDSAPEPLVRSNAVTALGDLAFRFPNLVEPWSSRIYSALQDKDVKVRKNTLMALTHLILNDMIKVKGQIVGLAICILDSDTRIADLARLFFFELARKAKNAIYNILPDTISCMSKMENLKSEHFKKVVAFLVGLMDKERHADGMVEKLCHRFRTSESDQENRDLAYCISLLNISERGVKKLNDSFKSYSAALSDDAVHTLMIQAINKGKKPGNSGAVAQVFEELFAKITEVRKSLEEEEDSCVSTVPSALSDTGEGEHKVDERGEVAKKSRTAKPTRRRKSVRFRKAVETADDEDISDEDSEEEEDEEKARPRVRRARSSAGRTEEDDEEGGGFDIVERETVPVRRTRRRKIVQEASEDGESSNEESSVDDEEDDSESE